MFVNNSCDVSEHLIDSFVTIDSTILVENEWKLIMAWSCSWGHHRTLCDNSLTVDNQYLLATTPANEQLWRY